MFLIEDTESDLKLKFVKYNDKVPQFEILLKEKKLSAEVTILDDRIVFEVRKDETHELTGRFIHHFSEKQIG